MTYVSNETELIIFENTFYPPANFTDFSVSKLTWDMNLAQIGDTDFTFSCAGSYVIFNEFDIDLYKLCGGKVFTIALLHLNNPNISLLKDCVENTYLSLNMIFTEIKAGTKAESFHLSSPINNEAFSSRIGMELLKYQ